MGTFEAGTQGAFRFEVQGIVGGRPRLVIEHVTRIDDDCAPDWPSSTAPGGDAPGPRHRPPGPRRHRPRHRAGGAGCGRRRQRHRGQPHRQRDPGRLRGGRGPGERRWTCRPSRAPPSSSAMNRSSEGQTRGHAGSASPPPSTTPAWCGFCGAPGLMRKTAFVARVPHRHRAVDGGWCCGSRTRRGSSARGARRCRRAGCRSPRAQDHRWRRGPPHPRCRGARRW